MIDDDRQRVRRAARSVGLYVGIASAIIIAAGVGILVAVIIATSRREGEDRGAGWPGRGPGDDFVVDVDRVLPVVLILGVGGVALLGVVAWFAARRSVRPLASALRQQRNFVADASHELRTPLTTLTSRIQLVQRRRARGEPFDDTLVELRADAAMMNDVLNDLLISAEASAVKSEQAADAVEAANVATASLRPLADESGVRLSVVAAGPVMVELVSVTLVRVLVALVDNAIQHSPRGGTVTVSVSREGAHAAVRVTDEGAGLAGIHPDQVFERFARSNESGRRRGFGLGLALVRDVTVRAGGSATIEQTTSAGTTFLIRLPLTT